jgi:hypothetical protein
LNQYFLEDKNEIMIDEEAVNHINFDIVEDLDIVLKDK